MDRLLPSKVFTATFAAGVLAEFVCEAMISRTIPREQRTLRVRFWTRYVMTCACFVLVGLVGHIVVDVMYRSGWVRMSWALALVPIVGMVAVSLSMQGANTALDGTSGSSCFGILIKSLSSSAGRKSSIGGLKKKEEKKNEKKSVSRR